MARESLSQADWDRMTDEERSQWNEAARRNNFAGGEPTGYEYHQLVTEHRQRAAARERARNSYRDRD